ncbi:MAG: glycoside hydrolase family 95 protein [Prevotellaceae bacterium]|jgi:alpha-L-fucosidase 2|nr:glycoside hydrolase family 95 protein [Prevotellaceae bacterium]
MTRVNVSPLALAAALLCGACACEQPQQSLQLWYNQPAEKWLDAAPLGNGRLGAMVYGGVDTDRIALNESSLWSGEVNAQQDPPFGAKRLADLRQLFFDGKLSEGNRVAAEWLHGDFRSFGTHLPLGDLKIVGQHEGKVEGYRRELDLRTAVNTVTYRVGGVQYKREYFISNPANVMVVRLSADKPGALTFDLQLDLLREAEVKAHEGGMLFAGKATFHKHGVGGVEFGGVVAVSADGGTVASDASASATVRVAGATAATIVIDVATSYQTERYEAEALARADSAVRTAYDSLKAAHVSDYAALFSRVELSLGAASGDKLPTDVRLQKVREGSADAAFDALFFQYGRYLLIASSRENSPLPANLQGIWNDNLACQMGWTCDYHLDINTQQNYWLANVGNLAECHAPLFTYTANLARHGAATAQKVYGCKGWCAHTVANIWGFSAPSQHIAWGLFPLAGSWLASHLWTQYLYTLDKDFLARTAYPLLKGNAQFLLDFLVKDPHSGYLLTGPCISPENGFRYQGQGLSASMMPTGDRALTHEILSACVQAAQALGIDKAFADSAAAALALLPPFEVGKRGAIQEWREDYDEAQPNHRHTMHLLGLYPLAQLSAGRTPQLAAAAAKVIENRLAAEGWEDTEWSRANFLCYYARLKNPAKAYENLQGLYKVFARGNLFCVAPAGVAGADLDIFEFDANEAAPAGMAELLVQSCDGCIELLPALPQQWQSGSLKGLCVAGGGEVDLSWRSGQVQRATLRATADNTFALRHPHSGELITVALSRGEAYQIVK